MLAFDASVMQSSKMRWMTSGEGAWGPVAGRDGPNMFRTADDQFRFAYTAKVVNRWINHDDDDDDDRGDDDDDDDRGDDGDSLDDNDYRGDHEEDDDDDRCDDDDDAIVMIMMIMMM